MGYARLHFEARRRPKMNLRLNRSEPSRAPQTPCKEQPRSTYLSNPDASPDKPRAAPASSKPSLMGESVRTSTFAKSHANNTRMLFELESSGRHRKPGWARALTLWLGAAALAAAAGAAWWSQQRPVLTPEPSLSRQPVALPAALPAAKVPDSNQAATRPALSASTAINVAPSVARIETASTAGIVSTVPAAVPVATTLALAAAVQKSVVVAASPPAKARAATTSKTPKSTKTAKKQTKQQLAKAKQRQQGLPQSTRLTKATPTGASGMQATSPGSGKDADILLLSALLAHVSRDPQGAPANSQAQQTIAQIVQRCEARGGKDTAETIECRRRICDGYWGKAQACPANLAPKKD